MTGDQKFISKRLILFSQIQNCRLANRFCGMKSRDDLKVGKLRELHNTLKTF